MQVLFMIVLNVILPVFALIVAGAFLHRKLKWDMGTLSKLSTYLLMPAVSFTNIYESKIGGESLFTIIGFLAVHNLALIAVSTAVSRAAGFEKSLSATFKNSVVLNNSGNFGLPVSQLVFSHNPIGASVQVVVTIFQNMLTYTYGLLNSVSVNSKGSKAVLEFLKLPTLYALLAGILLHSLSIPIPAFIWSPINEVADAFLAVALLTLGAQSAYLKLNRFSLPLILSLAGRLVLSPCIALALISGFRLDGTIAQALFIASSYPTSRNSALFALEYNNHPEYAAQTVLLSTLFSSVSVTAAVYLSKMLF